MRELNIWRDNNLSPWRGLFDLQRNLDRVLDQMWDEGPYLRSEEGEWYSPPCDIEDKGSHFVLSFDMPGIPKKDIDIEVKNNELVVSAERKFETRDKEHGRFERAYGKFYRELTLPVDADISKIEARYENGVLAVAIPKAESAKSRKIEIGEGKGFFSRLLDIGKGEKEDNKKPDVEKSTSVSAA